MKMSLSRWVAAAFALLTMATAAPARADKLFVPYLGVNFSGDAGKNFGNAFDAKQFNWGLSFAFMGGGVFGIEGDFGYSPDFFGKTDVGGSAVLTATGNLLLGVPFGGQHGFGVRPYGAVGLGVMRSSADFSSAINHGENDFTWDAGGGLLVFFGTRAGVRFDIRYFRTVDDIEILGIQLPQSPGKLDFTRGSVGFVLRF